MTFTYVDTTSIPHDQKIDTVAGFVFHTNINYSQLNSEPIDFVRTIYDVALNVITIDFDKLNLLKRYLQDHVTADKFDITNWFKTTPTDLLISTANTAACGGGWAGVVPGIGDGKFRPVKRESGYTLEHRTVDQTNTTENVTYGIFALSNVFKISYPVATWLFAPGRYRSSVRNNQDDLNMLIKRLDCISRVKPWSKQPVFN